MNALRVDVWGCVCVQKLISECVGVQTYARMCVFSNVPACECPSVCMSVCLNEHMCMYE